MKVLPKGFQRTNMKESKKRDASNMKKKKHNNAGGLESWDQTDLESADEKVLERRLHELKLQLKMEASAKRKKKTKSEVSSESDSSDSDSSVSTDSSSSPNRYNNKKSSSVSEDDRRRIRRNSPLNRRKATARDIRGRRSLSRNERDNSSFKSDKNLLLRRKPSPVHDKHGGFRSRAKRSPSPVDLKRDLLYGSRAEPNRGGRYDKGKERGIGGNIKRGPDNDHDRLRMKSHRTERSQRNSISPPPSRVRARSKEDRLGKPISRYTPVTSRGGLRKDSPERVRGSQYEIGGRRTATVTGPRKVSPRDDRLGR